MRKRAEVYELLAAINPEGPRMPGGKHGFGGPGKRAEELRRQLGEIDFALKSMGW